MVARGNSFRTGVSQFPSSLSLVNGILPFIVTCPHACICEFISCDDIHSSWVGVAE